MGGVLVPTGVDRVAHDVARLGEDLLDEGFVSTQGDPFSEVRGHTHHQAFTGLSSPPLLPLLLPALQLLHHGAQLVITRLLVQQLELLHNPQNRKKISEWVLIDMCMYSHVCMDEANAKIRKVLVIANTQRHCSSNEFL